jgi:hypothetical protein
MSVDPPSVKLTMRLAHLNPDFPQQLHQAYDKFGNHAEECPVDVMRALGGKYMSQEGSGGV